MSIVRNREKVIGDTIYFVENVVSERARETVYDKMKRMILNDVDHIPEPVPAVASARTARKTDNRIAS